jgi:hypothetical protein
VDEGVTKYGQECKCDVCQDPARRERGRLAILNNPHGLTVDDMSCSVCPHEPGCEFAWDLYNTAGDCLAEK